MHRKQVFAATFLLLIGLMSAQCAVALEAQVMRNIFYAPAASGTLQPYLEAYWQINPQTILFDKQNDSWQAKIRTDIVVSNSSGVINEEHYILETKPVMEGSLTLTQTIIDLRRYTIKPGLVHLEVKFSDGIKKGNEFVYKDSFMVDEPGKKPMISGIQLVDTTFPSNAENVFQRNNQIQIPLCTNFIDDSRKAIKYYFELYNTDIGTANQEPITCKTYISRKQLDLPYYQLEKIDTVKRSLLQFIHASFSTTTLKSGNYYLNVVLENKTGERLATRSLPFQVMNTKPEMVTQAEPDTATTRDESLTYLDLNKTYIGKYTPSQVRAILKMLAPIADPNERISINGFLKKPDDTYSRYFIYNFWLKRNATNAEQAWKEYAEKVKKVNKLFGSSMLPGYENDRGIIYLKYGEPTQRLVVENENGAYPYEVWQYNSLPNATDALFLFYRTGLMNNDFRLLTSTVNGEVRNRSWRTNLYITGAAMDPTNSKAEQYLGNRY